MELTKWQTRQINNFLESIGVVYIDIRFEMVDHIATEIEENIEDIDAFFEHKGFQTPFLKYMLSKKDVLRDKYEKKLKIKFWYNHKIIGKDILKFGIQLKNLILLLFIVSITYTLNQFNLQYSVYTLFGLSITVFFLNSYTFNKLVKKYGNIKLIQTYVSLLGVLSYIPIYTINIISSHSNNNLWYVYSQIAFLYLVILLYKSFNSRKEIIENKYEYLIQ